MRGSEIAADAYVTPESPRSPCATKCALGLEFNKRLATHFPTSLDLTTEFHPFNRPLDKRHCFLSRTFASASFPDIAIVSHPRLSTRSRSSKHNSLARPESTPASLPFSLQCSSSASAEADLIVRATSITTVQSIPRTSPRLTITLKNL